jgi:hypothetical protein
MQAIRANPDEGGLRSSGSLPPEQRLELGKSAKQFGEAAQHALRPQIHLHLHGTVSAAEVAMLIACQATQRLSRLREENQ